LFCVWRPGSGGQHWHYPLTIEQFEQKANDYFKKGYRLALIDKRDENFVGVWHQGSGAERCESTDPQSFYDKDKTYRSQGLLLQQIGGRSTNPFGLWHPDDGSERWWVGLNENDFQYKDSTYFDEGFRLAGLRVRYEPQRPDGLDVVLQIGLEIGST